MTIEPTSHNSTPFRNMLINRHAWALGLVSLIVLLPLHLGAVLLSSWLSEPPKPTGDGPDYEAIGYCISNGDGWSTSFSDQLWRNVYEASHNDYSIQLDRTGPTTPETSRPPLFPALIGLTYRVLPRGPIAFSLIRFGLAACFSIASSIAIVWGALIVQKWTAHGSMEFQDLHVQRISIWSIAIAVIAIVYSERNLRNYATDFLTEPLALVLTQAFLIFAWLGVQQVNQSIDADDHAFNSNWLMPSISGFLFACMYLTRGVFVLWVPLIAIWLYFSFEQKVAPVLRVRWLSVFVLVVLVCSMPWWIRNCVVLNSFSPLGTKGSTTMLGGYCDEAFEAYGEWQYGPEKALRNQIELELHFNPTTATSQEVLTVERTMAIESGRRVRTWISTHFAELPQLVCMRLFTEWNPYTGKACLLKIAAIAGVIGLWRRDRKALWWLAGPLVINSIVVAATYSVGGRFLVPTYGAFYLLAAFGFVFAWYRLINPFFNVTK